MKAYSEAINQLGCELGHQKYEQFRVNEGVCKQDLHNAILALSIVYPHMSYQQIKKHLVIQIDTIFLELINKHAFDLGKE